MRKIEIINNGASLKIIADGVTRNILKHQIREVSVINDTIIKIDIGLGILNNIFLEFNDVSSPIAANPSELVEAINAMLLSNCTGVATEANQEIEIGELRNIKTSFVFQKEAISDKTNPKTIYMGYAVPGSLTSDAVWAIEKITNDKEIYSYKWASGNKNFDKVWDNRKTLQYS